jgi:predicted membrane protein
MYKAYLCTMIRRKERRTNYCLSFVLCLLIIVHRYALYILFVLRSFLLIIVHRYALYILICTRHTYVQWSEDKERRTNNMYKAWLCTMIRRQSTKDRQYVQGIPMYNGQKIKNEGQTICTRHTYVSLSSDHCT